MEGGVLSVFLSAQHTPDQPDLVVPYVYQAAWSADGRYLAYADGFAGLQVWDFETNAASLSLPQLNPAFTWFSGHPSLAVLESIRTENRTIALYDALTGQAHDPLIAPEAWAGWGSCGGVPMARFF